MRRKAQVHDQIVCEQWVLLIVCFELTLLFAKLFHIETIMRRGTVE